MPGDAGTAALLPLDAGGHGRELALAMKLAEAAATAIRRLFESGPITVREKADHSPVAADDEIIVTGLRAALPDDAILTEEVADNGRRFATDRVRLVDPLDGTSDFVEWSHEFAVHITLLERGRPVLGVVALPMLGQLAAAVHGAGAVIAEASGARRLSVARPRDIGALRTGVSRYAMNLPLETFLERTGLRQHAVPCGASVNQIRLAEGTPELCLTPHARECEWGSAAPGLIVTEAGGGVTDVDGAGMLPPMTRRVFTVDGIDGSGKSTFARRVVAALTAAGSHTVLVRVDDFRRPSDWDSAEEATLYYEQCYDLEALGAAVLAFAAGAAVLELPEFDGIAGRSLPPRPVVLAPDTILLTEGGFVRRIQLGDAPATHNYLHAPGATARRQLVARDVARGRAPAEIDRRLDRCYIPGQTRYHAACDPRARADILVENSDTAAPRPFTISPEMLPPLLSQVLSQLVPQ